MEKLEQLVPLEVAAEHYAAAMVRGELAGRAVEYTRILEVLKKHGHYDAVLTLKSHEKKASQWNSQKVI